MKDNRQLLTVETIFPIIVIVFCLINLGNHDTILNPLSAIVSILGLTGSITWFLRKPHAIKLLYAWLLLQVIIIKPYYDVSQFFSFNFYIGSDNIQILSLIHI